MKTSILSEAFCRTQSLVFVFQENEDKYTNYKSIEEPYWLESESGFLRMGLACVCVCVYVQGNPATM